MPGVWMQEASAFLSRADSRCLGLSARGARELVIAGLPIAEDRCIEGIPCVGTPELNAAKAALVELMNDVCDRIPPDVDQGLCGGKGSVDEWAKCVADAQVLGTQQIANALFGGGGGPNPTPTPRATPTPPPGGNTPTPVATRTPSGAVCQPAFFGDCLNAQFRGCCNPNLKCLFNAQGNAICVPPTPVPPAPPTPTLPPGVTPSPTPEPTPTPGPTPSGSALQAFLISSPSLLD